MTGTLGRADARGCATVGAGRTRRLLPLLVLLLLALTACAGGAGTGGGGSAQEGTEQAEPTATAAAEDAEPVELRFAWWGGDTRHEATQEAIALFEEKNPGITVVPEFSGFDGYFEQLATEVAGGNAPDIIQMDYRYLSEYAERGALLDLGTLPEGTLSLDGFDEGLLNSGRIDDTLYALPFGINTQVVMANTDALEAAGVEAPDDASWTWDDFAAYSSSVTAGSGGELYGSQDPSWSEPYLEVFLLGRGEALYGPEGIVATEEGMTAWWEMWQRMRQSGAAVPPEVTASEDGTVENSAQVQGAAALGFAHSNQLANYQEAGAAAYQLLQFPQGPETTGQYLKPAMMATISATSEHPEEAARFLAFMLNSEEAGEIVLAERGLPPNEDVRDAVLASFEPTDQAGAEYLASSEFAPTPSAPPPGAGEVYDLIDRLSESLLFEQVTVEEAVAQFFDEAPTYFE